MLRLPDFDRFDLALQVEVKRVTVAEVVVVALRDAEPRMPEIVPFLIKLKGSDAREIRSGTAWNRRRRGTPWNLNSGLLVGAPARVRFA